MKAFERLARKLWFNSVVREGILLVVTSVAIVFFTQLNSLADLIAVSDAPLSALKTWAGAMALAVFSTGIKQAAVYALTAMGRIVTTSAPKGA